MAALVSSVGVSAAVESPERLAIVGARVLTMGEPAALDDQTVIVAGGRIERLGDRRLVEVSPGTRLIAAEGRTLMPGLVDAHIHLRAAQPAALLDYLRTGITTARELNGRPLLLEWRDRVEAGELLGPTLQVAGPTIGNFSSPRDGYPTPESAAEGQAAVTRYHAAGYDWIKVYSFLNRDAFEGVVAAAKRLGVPVAGHVPIEVGLDAALSSGMRSVEHLTEYVGTSLVESERAVDQEDFRSIFGAGEIDWELLARLCRATAAAGVWNVPTLIWFDRHLPAPMARDAWADPALRRQGESDRRRLVALLHEHGAPLAVGTDSDAGGDLPPAAIHQELAAMVDAGLTARDVLSAATLGGATLLGVEDEIGTIEVGKRADLLLLGCDPLERISCTGEIELVIARGRPVD